MSRSVTSGLLCGVLVAAFALSLHAEPEHREEHAPPPGRAAPSHPPAEPHPGPSGYQRPAEPPGWNARPHEVDRQAYQHNFQAARSFAIGPYHRPNGWVDRRWSYGQILPPALWAAPYILADYWLFALEVPPVGFEWVRVGSDALLVNVASGEILQVEYGVFS